MSLSRVFNFTTATLVATVGSVIALKTLPPQYQAGHLAIFALAFALSYGTVALYNLVIYPFMLSPLRHLPGSKFSFSHIIKFGDSVGLGKDLMEANKQHPDSDLIALNLPRGDLYAAKPQIMADILVHKAYDFTKPPQSSSLLTNILGRGLVNAEGDYHKFMRKNTQPSFNFRNIKNLYPMIWNKALQFAEIIETSAREGGQHPMFALTGKEPLANSVEIHDWLSKVTLDVIGLAGLGRNFNMLQNTDDPLLQVYSRMMGPDAKHGWYFALCSIFGIETVRMFPFKHNQELIDNATELRVICRGLMKEKRVQVKEDPDGQVDIIALLIKSDNFSDDQLVDQLLTFLAAGHETTSSALSWATYLLAIHQDIQDKVRQEVLAALPANDDDDGTRGTSIPPQELAATLESLPYLNGVINETLRLYPTVPSGRRYAIRDTVVGGHAVPRGSLIILSQWAMQHSEAVWGEGAEEFRPQRWINVEEEEEEEEVESTSDDDEDEGYASKAANSSSSSDDNNSSSQEKKKKKKKTTKKTKMSCNTNGGAKSNYEFLTFLHGPRSCIGQGFARAEMRCLLAAMVMGNEGKGWDLGMPEEEVEPIGAVTIQPKSGMWLRMK